MKIIFTSYAKSPEYDQPGAWLKRIDAYTGILEALNRHHEVVGIERINYEGEFRQNGVMYYFVKQKRKIVYFPWRLHRLIKKLAPDVVFINGFIFPLQIMQLRLSLDSKVRIVVIHRSEKPFTGIKKYLQYLADRCVDAYWFTSHEFGGYWIKKGNISGSNKIHEIMHASSVFFPAERTLARSGTGVDGSPVFLWVGRLNQNKDPLTVLRGFRDFLTRQPSATLYMIYQTEDLLVEIKQLLESKPELKDAVKLIGAIPHQQLQSWYNSADFIISGSHYEGGGVSVCEAMSCGCIPLLTNIASFREMTGRGKCGLLYEPGNADDLVKALLKTPEMDKEKEREKVLQQFNDELSFAAIATKIEQMMQTWDKV